MKLATDTTTWFLLILLAFLILSLSILLGAGYQWGIIVLIVIFCMQIALILVWRRTEKRLRQSGTRLRKIIDNLPVAISCSDQNNNLIFNNKKYMEVIGYSIEDTPTIHAWFEKAYPDEDARNCVFDKWMEKLESLKYEMNRQPLTYTISFTCRDSSIKSFAFTYFMDGEYSYAVFNDITDRLQAEKALRASRETLSLATELARLGPWKYNAQNNMFEFGDEFYAIYGTDVAREGVFMTPDMYARELVHPDDAWIVGKAVNNVFNSTKRQSTDRLEHRIIRRDGEVRTIAVVVNYTKDADGKIIKYYGANQDITEQKQAEDALRKKTEEVQRLAYTDSLTGLPNRAHLIKHLDGEMKKAHRGKAVGTILFIDLDNLKMVNDTFGHTYGDELIVMAGNRIMKRAGNGALVGRIGGDEFMAILPGENNRQCISRIVGDIIAELNQDIEVLGVRFHISASAGVAIYPQDGDTAEEIFKNADNAMYAAKKAGRNCWRFYEAIMQAEAYEKILLTNSLHNAVERGELLLHYQPQVSVESGAVVGFEALLRWKSREHGFVSPAQFIPLAEQSGLIYTIGEWVLREACRFARRLADQGWGNVYVSVNVSPYQLCSDLFIDNIRGALNDFGVEPRRLELEITETSLLALLEESTRRLDQLHAMGVRLALDDFGTGYSSLNYLLHLPVNTLKIDKSFIEMIPVDGAHKAIIGSVVNMAHTMQMSVVAEGVETHEQFIFLDRICCDCVQGYFFSRPVPEEETVRFLSRYPQGVRLII